MAIKFDIKTGQVFIRNFDQGLVETLGGYLEYAQSGNPKKKNYFIKIVGCDPCNVPVIFHNPFQLQERKILPCFMVQRSDIRPNMARWHSIGGIQYEIDVGDTVSAVGRDGKIVYGSTEKESLVQAFPYDIEYTINILARYEHEAIPMVKRVLSIYKPYSKILIKDSLGEQRSYTVFNDSSVQDISEIVDIQDRMKAYSITIRVEAELDLSDPETNGTVQTFIQNLRKLN